MMLGQWLSASKVCDAVLALQRERPYHAALCWRAASFRTSVGAPMTYRRAEALNAVLDQCDLPLTPGELLLGSSTGRFTASGDPEALREARQYLEGIGGRSFLTNLDHIAPDYPLLLEQGIGGLRRKAERSLANHSEAQKKVFLESVLLALGGVRRHIGRWADAAAQAALDTPQWAELLSWQVEMLTHLQHGAPRTFWEALQLTYLMHCIFQLDERYAMAFGRIDQFLYPFYQADLAAGRISNELAQELLTHFFAKAAHHGDIQNICIGGVDEEGSDATNELSTMCLEACQRVGQPGGNLTARIHARTPQSFLYKCAEVIRTGIGFPALFNDEIQIPALVEQGYPLQDARNYCFVGCIETHIPGKQGPWSDSRFNLLRCVDRALRNGLDGLTRTQLGPLTGAPGTWEAFFAAFLTQMRAGLKQHIMEINAIKQAADGRAEELTSPLLSALVADCIEEGMDVCAGGARFPANHGVAGMGLGSVADSLMVIKRVVYEQGRFTLDSLRHMLDVNFEGYQTERQLLLNGAPKYGNDDPEVDAIAVRVAREFGQECLKYRTPTNGRYWGLLAANISNIYAGREVGATPDGRLAQEPLSDAGSPTFGRDVNGPTAVIRSVARVDYRLLPGGNVVNMKFHSSSLAEERGLAALASLVRTCFDLGGIQLQFNTSDSAMLQDAMEHPEKYRNLVVRVSGFSAYFVNLDRAVQQDILARTTHTFA